MNNQNWEKNRDLARDCHRVDVAYQISTQTMLHAWVRPEDQIENLIWDQIGEQIRRNCHISVYIQDRKRKALK